MRVAVLDLASERVVSLDLSGPAGRLVVSYSGEAESVAGAAHDAGRDDEKEPRP